MKSAILGAVLFCCLPAPAQRDFLTTDEADQIREAQDPNDRLTLYTDFARQRLDQVQQLIKDQKPGRGGMIHDLLEDYNKIIEAIDTVSDDALQRKVDIAAGTKAVAGAEKHTLATLERIRDSKPADLSRYDFLLEQAIETTKDSLDLAQQDLGKRSGEVAEREKKEKKQRESVMGDKEAEEHQASAAKKEPGQRKKPTLLKKGETVQQPH